MKKIKLISITCILFVITLFSTIYASDVFSSDKNKDDIKNSEQTLENVTNSAAQMYNLDEFVNTINDSVNKNIGQEIDFKNIANDVLNKNNINHKNLILKIVELFSVPRSLSTYFPTISFSRFTISPARFERRVVSFAV